MFDLLDKLREWPEHKKHALALSVSALVSAIVFAFWFGSIIPRAIDQAQIAKKEAQEIVTPMANLKRGFVQVYANLQKEYGSVKNLLANPESASLETYWSETVEQR